MTPSREEKAGTMRSDDTLAHSLFWENARDILLIIRDDGRIIDANRTAVAAYGYGKDELLSLRIHDLRDPDTVPLVDDQMTEADRCGILFETVHRRRDGSTFPVEVSSRGATIGEERVLLSVIRDITARRETERQIAESLAFNQKIIDASPLGILTYDSAGQCVSANEATGAIIGATREQVLRQNFRQIETFRRTGLVTLAEEALATGAERRIEFRAVSTFGKEVWLDCRLVPFLSRGEPHLLLLCNDVREQRMSQESLLRLATAVGQSAEIIMITDTDGVIQYTNPAFERITGYGRDEVAGKTPRILKSGKQDSAFYEDLWNTLRGGGVWTGTFVNRRKDGTLYEEEAVISPVRDPGGAVINYVAVKRDVTSERRVEEQFRQAQKMEAVGRLAGGIAHDFNNLLTAITGYSDLLLQTLREPDPARREVQEIRKASDRAAALTRQLLAFSRRQVLQPKILDLNRVVANMEKMLHRLIGEDIELVTRPADDLGTVKADQGQIEQVIVNLAVNSRDAMPKGGKLILETANVELDESYASRHDPVQPGSYVMLAVTDTGLGMDERTMSRIFEPFFTTKEVGKGTGLGLATVYGIVKQSGGYIWAYSEAGRGTTFKIYLPREKAVLEPAEKEAPPPYPPEGKETVLVVEDEKVVRELVREILAHYGYDVLEAGRGAEAIAASRRHRGPIHLLVTDVVMPGMSGPDLARRLTSHRPEMRVIFMSGYTDEAILHHGVLGTGTEFLQKPFTAKDLGAKVRKVLDRRAGVTE